MAKRELNKKSSELLVTISATKKDWVEEQAKAFKILSKDLVIKGFRKGQVPPEVAKKNIHNQEVQAKAITKMLEILVKEAAKEIKEGEMVLDGPTYKVDKISDVELEVTFVYPLYPDIKLADYKTLGVKFVEAKPGPKAVDDEIKRMLSSQAMLTVKNGAIAKGDTVNFDFEGFVDGKAFDGGAAKGYELEIGSGQFIPGFEDQMVGLKAKDKKDVAVTFPKEYHSEALKGKKATFKVSINAVKVKELAELNDEFVKTSGVPNVKTVPELKAYIKEVFTTQEKMNARSTFQREVFAKIKKTTELNIPTALIGKEMQSVQKQFQEQLSKQGLDIVKYKEMTGLDDVKLASQWKAQAEERLKDSLIFAEVAKKEKIKIVDADYEKEYKKLAKVYNQSEDAIKGMVTKEQMQIPMTNDRVIDVLIKASK